MKKINYFFITFYFFILFLNSCSYFKDKDEKTNESYSPAFVQTVAKPDQSLRGLKVSLPKPVINNTWSQLTNNEAHKILHPLVGKKISLFWKTSIGKGQNKKKPISSQPVIDQKKIYTLDTKNDIVCKKPRRHMMAWERLV